MNLTFNDKLNGLGIRITGSAPLKRPQKFGIDIEQTLIEALLQFPGDARLVSLIFSWIKVHGAYVIVEKLAKYTSRYPEKEYPSMRWISALAAFAFDNGYYKWKKLIRRSKNPVFLFPKEITKSAIGLKGSVSYLEKLNFFIPKDAIRIREDDVLSPSELIKWNRQYRNRYLYGASWRADIITAIESGLKSPVEISRLIGCSYEPAYRIFREYLLAVSR